MQSFTQALTHRRSEIRQGNTARGTTAQVAQPCTISKRQLYQIFKYPHPNLRTSRAIGRAAIDQF